MSDIPEPKPCLSSAARLETIRELVRELTQAEECMWHWRDDPEDYRDASERAKRCYRKLWDLDFKVRSSREARGRLRDLEEEMKEKKQSKPPKPKEIAEPVESEITKKLRAIAKEEADALAEIKDDAIFAERIKEHYRGKREALFPTPARAAPGYAYVRRNPPGTK